MSKEEHTEFELSLTLEEGYRFTVEFDQEGVPPLLLDEPPPLGEGTGPNAARILAAAVGNCLSASLLFCMRKVRIQSKKITTTVHGTLVRNAEGRFRIGEIRVLIEPSLTAEERDRISRCMDVFEDYCIVTESVRQGVDVLVEVQPRTIPDEETEEVPASARAGGG